MTSTSTASCVGCDSLVGNGQRKLAEHDEIKALCGELTAAHSDRGR